MSSRLALRVALLYALLCAAHAVVLDSARGTLTLQHFTAAFGPLPGTYNVSGRLVRAQPVLACEPDWSLQNAAEVRGSVALIRRGSCAFSRKVTSAQRAGAVGVIVGDNASDGQAVYIRMSWAANDSADLPAVPSVFVSAGDFARMSQLLDEQGGLVNATLDARGEVGAELPLPQVASLRTIGIMLMLLPTLWCLFASITMLRRACLDRLEQRERRARLRRIAVQPYRVAEDVSASEGSDKAVEGGDSVALGGLVPSSSSQSCARPEAREAAGPSSAASSGPLAGTVGQNASGDDLPHTAGAVVLDLPGLDEEEARPIPRSASVPGPASAPDSHSPSNSQTRHGSRSIHNENCAICLEDFVPGVAVKVLPCRHAFHPQCIDPWVIERSDLCPICKRSILDSPPTCADRCLTFF